MERKPKSLGVKCNWERDGNRETDTLGRAETASTKQSKTRTNSQRNSPKFGVPDSEKIAKPARHRI